MTIDEAIAKYKEIVNTDANCPAHCNISCDKCVQESKQIAEWLELLKWYEQGMEDIPSESGVLPKDVYHAGYNKAIDDFLEAIDRADREEPLILDMYEIEQIAEQLKRGAENEQSI